MKKIINPLNKAEKIITETMVSEVMITNIMSLKIEDNADEAIKLMAENSISGVLIKDEKNKTI
ncbi:MAG: hypothetical protein QXM96_02675, partial [Candidatus Woesearchaeota archaeon]